MVRGWMGDLRREASPGSRGLDPDLRAWVSPITIRDIYSSVLAIIQL